MSKISLIIPVFNSSRFIRACLDSIINQYYQDFEIILVDNGSKDNTLSLIKEFYPELRVIDNRENLGACTARNKGIEIAGGEWILTLDCDTVLEKDFLKKLMEFADESEDDVGMFQPKILQMDKKSIYSCGIYLSNLRRFYDIGRGRFNNGKFDKMRYIFGPCSAAALYKRQMLEEIKEDSGYFDKRFFFLVEDVDLAWRAQRKGWKAVFCPAAVCCHYGNSSKTNKKLRQYLCFRNRYYSIIKNKGLSAYSRNIIYLLLYDVPRLFYLILTNPYIFKGIKELSGFLYDNSSSGHRKCYSSNLS